jgi:hypothetical protein
MCVSDADIGILDLHHTRSDVIDNPKNTGITEKQCYSKKPKKNGLDEIA